MAHIHSPLVSIAITVFNAASFLEKTLESILAQNYDNLEIIISDNASDDGSSLICQHYAKQDKRIKYYRNNINIGPTKNAEKAYRHCSGDYIMFAADHDIYPANYISRLLKELTEDTSVVLSFGRTVFIDEHDNAIEMHPDTLDTRGLNKIERFSKVIWEFGWGSLVYGLYRMDAFRKAWQPFDVIGPDHVFTANLSLIGSFAMVDEPLFFRRRNRPNEDRHAARKRYVDWFVNSHYETLVPLTRMAYEHIKILSESDLDPKGKEFLYEEVKKCFRTRYGSELQDEAHQLITEGTKLLLNLSKFPASRKISEAKLQALANICVFFLPESKNLNSFYKSFCKFIETDSEKVIANNLEVSSHNKQFDIQISILIPTYNRSRFLADAISSSLAQSYENFEIVVVDDGSTDNTPEIVRGFNESKLRYIIKEHSGAPATRNRCIAEARGEFILWLDSDDVLMPDTLDRYVSMLQQVPDADVLYGNLVITDEQLRPQRSLMYEDWYGRNSELLARMVHENLIPNPGTLIRKNCFERIGLYDETFRRAHDYQWWSRLIKAANFKHVDTTVLKWRWHESNLGAGQKEVDTTFEGRVLMGMLHSYPLRELYPDIDWHTAPLCHAEAAAYLRASIRLIEWKHFPGALEYLGKSHQLYPREETRELLERLGQLLPAQDPPASLSKSKGLRILIACDYFWPSIGGLEVIAENLGVRLQAMGHTVEIATGALPNRAEDKHRGLNILSLDRTPEPGTNTPKAANELRQLVSSGGYDACILLADPLNWVIWSIEGVVPPTGTTVVVQPLINEEGFTVWKDNASFRSRLATILRNVHAVVALSRGGAEVRFLREERIASVYIPNGTDLPDQAIDFRKAYSIPAETPLFLHVANLWPVKNHIGILRTLREMPGDWRLVMIGHPSSDSQYVESVRHEAALDRRVILVPGLPSEEVAAAMEAADVVLLASHGEVSPVTIMEAMSHGRPWLATPECGAVHDFAGGIIAPLPKFPELLDILTKDTQFRRDLGETGLGHWRACFSWEVVADAWDELIRTKSLSTSFAIPESIAIRRNELTPNYNAPLEISQESKPLVSVIVPTYNRPDMLPDTLRSILAQTYVNIEIIVINDAGQDVEQLVKEVAPGAFYICHERNKGLAGARNTGINHAQGKYIAYLDDDDIFYPEHVETLVTFLEESNHKVAYTDASRAHLTMKDNQYTVVKRDYPYSTDFDYDQILVDNFIPVLCVMHEKSCTNDVGNFDESLKRHEDWELWIRMSRKFRFAHIPKITCEFSWRPDGNSMTASTKPMFLETMTAVYEKHRGLSTPDIEKRRRAHLWGFMLNMYSFLEGHVKALLPLFTSGRISEGSEKLAALAVTGAKTEQLESCLANLLALHAFKNGDTVAAIDHLEQAVAHDGMNPIACHNLAHVYRTLGRNTDAARVYRHIINRNESDKFALIALAEIAREDGSTAEAHEYCNKILTIDPQNQEAVQVLHSLPETDPIPAAKNQLTVALLSLDPPSHACYNLRIAGPAGAFADKVELLQAVTNDGTRYLFNAEAIDRADLIIVQRFFPRPETEHHLQKALASGKPIIYEFNDLLTDHSPANPHRDLSSHCAPFISALLASAEGVTVSTDLLASALPPCGGAVHVLPNLLDESLWGASLPSHTFGAPVVIGYAGTPGHEGDLIAIEEALEKITQKYGTRVAFRFYGCTTERIRKLPGFSFAPFVDDYADYAVSLRNSGIDIGLVPLEDNRFNRCKSNIKWLEYSACGIAGVYADLPPYRSCVKDGETGILVGGYDVDAWVAAIERLIDNPDRRHAMALAARTEVLANYTLKSRGHLFLETWRTVAGRSETSPAKEQGMNASLQPFAPGTTPSGAATPQVSIIIPLYNKVEYTKQCLEALALNTDQSLGYEVILVDNASSDGTAEYLRTLSGDVTIVTNLKNLGFAKACNQGGRIARGRYLVFLNNDTIPHPGWLNGLIKGAEQDGADIVGARLLYPNGRVQHAGVAFNEQSIGYHIFNGFPADAPAVNRKRFMQCVTAACMLVKQELFAELGGFDEGYVNGFEDVDFCLRAGERGRRILYTPESVLIHFEETSEGRKDHDTPNIRRFLARWEGKVRWDHQDIYRSEGYRAERQADGRLRIYQADAAPVSSAPTPPPAAASTAPQQVTPTPGTGAAAATPSVSGREKALALKAEGRYVEAIEHLVKIVTAGDNSVLVDLGDCLASLEKYDDALALYQESLVLCPTNGRALVGVGVVRYMTRRIAEAADAFSRALEIDPADPKALCGLGMARCAQGRNAEGFELYGRALEAEPENLTAVHESVRLAYELGRFNEAARRLESYLRHHPGDIDILFACAGLLHMAGRNADARDALERLLVFSPDYSGAMELLAKLEGRDQEPGERATEAEARRLKEDGKYEEALAAFSRAAEAGDSSALADMGDCLAQLGRLDEATARYLEALDADGTDLKALVGLGVVSLVQGKQVKAVTWFNRALKADPANAKALCGLGMVRNMQNKHDEAFSLLARAVDADPEGLTALHELIRLSYATGRFDEAGERLDRYLMHHPADLDMVFAQAGIRFKAGRYAEALSSIETVLLFASDYEGGLELREAITQAM
ncbi:glycosyltransferase [Geobacter sulfurreducens]|uniref:glycosyltransferase n=1 Tax=Geobacter sulfurreducens TaxID=35554 RepID=UPI0001E34285|nr:multiple glycosyl transferase domain and TPR domain protein [Geobacter sulfurreducens KN400]